MKKERIIEIIGEIDEQYINEAVLLEKSHANGEKNPASLKEKKLKINRRNLIWIAAAAILVLVMAGGAVFGAVSAEAKEYEKAAAFFEENGLSSEGLSRAEIRAVYRDITTKHFTNEKTAEVLRKSVPGFEIGQEEPTPEEMAAAWDRLVWKRTVSQKGYYYETEASWRESVSGSYGFLEKTTLKCYRDGALLWTTEFPAQNVGGQFRTDGVTAVWGTWERQPYGNDVHAWVAVVDDSGKQLWRKTLEHDLKSESIGGVAQNGDGTWTVASRGIRAGETDIFLTTFDNQGRVLSSYQIENDDFYSIHGIVRAGDGYLMSLGKFGTEETNLFLQTDMEGKILDRFSIEAEDCDYYFTDMVEYAGQIWLSGYTTPKQPQEYGRGDIYHILQYIIEHYHEKNIFDVPSEELTGLLRENYTAVLVLLEADGRTPRTFYSVPGSLGADLSVNGAGYLDWKVESIMQSFYSPATSSFSIGGNCKVFRYSFDENGTLVHQEDTLETVPYRR